MVNMKIDLKGSGVDVQKKSGFEPYEGPMPKPGVYAAVINSCKVRVSQAGNAYFNIMYELADQQTPEKQEFKGAPVWDRVVPGESDVQKERVAKFLHAVSGKDPSKVNIGIDHDEVTDGGKVNKIGGKDPIGIRVRLTVNRGTDNQQNPEIQVRDLFPWPKDVEWPEGQGAVVASEEEEETEEIEESDETQEAEDAAEEETDTEEEEDDSEEEGDDEEESEEPEEDEDDEAFEARQAELRELDRTALKKILKEADPEFKVLKRHSDEDLANAIIDVEFPPVDGEGEEEDPF